MNNTGALSRNESVEWTHEPIAAIVPSAKDEQDAATSRFATSRFGILISDLQMRIVSLVRNFRDTAHLLGSCTYTYEVLCGRMRADGIPCIIALEILKSQGGDFDRAVCHVPDTSKEVFSVLLGNTRPHSRNIRDESLARAVQHAPDLERLDLSCAFCLTDKGILAVAENCHHLKKLYLVGCHNVSDQSVVELIQRCKELVSLDLSFTNITDVTLDTIEKCGSQLKKLDLRGCQNLTTAFVLRFREHSQAIIQYWPLGFSLSAPATPVQGT